jgi:hypothetical protein
LKCLVGITTTATNVMSILMIFKVWHNTRQKTMVPPTNVICVKNYKQENQLVLDMCVVFVMSSLTLRLNLKIIWRRMITCWLTKHMTNRKYFVRYSVLKFVLKIFETFFIHTDISLLRCGEHHTLSPWCP